MTELSSRVITIHKRKTTMRLCKNEWEALKDICKREKINRKMLLEMIESRKDPKLGQPVTAGFSVALNRITVQFSGFCQKDTGIIINFGDFLITHNFSFLFAKKRSGLYSLEAAEPMLNKHSLLQALCVVLICLNISKILS